MGTGPVFHPSQDTGVTLLEVVLALVMLGLVLPAVFASYMTAVRTNEATLARLRCASVGRQEVETVKSRGFRELWDISGEGFRRITDEANYNDTGISIATDIKRMKLGAESGTSADSIQVKIVASKGKVRVPFDFILVEGGY